MNKSTSALTRVIKLHARERVQIFYFMNTLMKTTTIMLIVKHIMMMKPT